MAISPPQSQRIKITACEYIDLDEAEKDMYHGAGWMLARFDGGTLAELWDPLRMPDWTQKLFRLENKMYLCKKHNQMLADAINVADSACRADIECECRRVGSHDAGHWYDTTQYDPTKYNPEIGDVIAIAVRYLEARGILIRKDGEPHVVTFACD